MVATFLENQTAAMLAKGTANPGNIVPQDEYPDWYFRVTRSDHLTELKAKLKRIGTTQIANKIQSKVLQHHRFCCVYLQSRLRVKVRNLASRSTISSIRRR